MDRSGPPAHRRVAAAIAVSILLHALAGLGWWATQGHTASAAPGIGTRVEGPPEAETTFVLCDPPAPRPRPLPAAVIQPVRPTEPVVPAVAVGSAPKRSHSGAPTQSGTSPDGAGSLPKSGGAKALHAPLRPGQSIVYVLDRSSSMGTDGLLPAAIRAIKASLATLGPDVRFQVVAYNGSALLVSPALMPATAANVRSAEAWLDQLRAEGRSEHVAGIREALYLQPGAILLMTDADDLGDEEARRIAKLIRRPVRLDAAVFSHRRSAAVTPLERLFREHGGAVQYVGP